MSDIDINSKYLQGKTCLRKLRIFSHVFQNNDTLGLADFSVVQLNESGTHRYFETRELISDPWPCKFMNNIELRSNGVMVQCTHRQDEIRRLGSSNIQKAKEKDMKSPGIKSPWSRRGIQKQWAQKRIPEPRATISDLGKGFLHVLVRQACPNKKNFLHNSHSLSIHTSSVHFVHCIYSAHPETSTKTGLQKYFKHSET